MVLHRKLFNLKITLNRSVMVISFEVVSGILHLRGKVMEIYAFSMNFP